MELKGTNFILRGWKKDDAVPLQKHADNANISDFLLDRFPSPYTMGDAISWIALMQNQNPLTTFVIAVENELVMRL